MALFREQETEGSERRKDEGLRRLTLDAIAQRHLTDDELQQDAEKKAEALGRLRRLRLDHMQLGELDALESMGPITHLFLHHNLLREVDDVALLPHLRFLSLAHNRIERVPDLRSMTSLVLLDLSDNQIAHLEPAKALPTALSFFLIQANPCCGQPDLRRAILQVAANLKQLDGVDVDNALRREIGVEEMEESEAESGSDNEEDGDEAGSTNEREAAEAPLTEGPHGRRTSQGANAARRSASGRSGPGETARTLSSASSAKARAGVSASQTRSPARVHKAPPEPKGVGQATHAQTRTSRGPNRSAEKGPSTSTGSQNEEELEGGDGAEDFGSIPLRRLLESKAFAAADVYKPAVHALHVMREAMASRSQQRRTLIERDFSEHLEEISDFKKEHADLLRLAQSRRTQGSLAQPQLSTGAASNDDNAAAEKALSTSPSALVRESIASMQRVTAQALAESKLMNTNVDAFRALAAAAAAEAEAKPTNKYALQLARPRPLSAGAVAISEPTPVDEVMVEQVAETNTGLSDDPTPVNNAGGGHPGVAKAPLERGRIRPRPPRDASPSARPRAASAGRRGPKPRSAAGSAPIGRGLAAAQASTVGPGGPTIAMAPSLETVRGWSKNTPLPQIRPTGGRPPTREEGTRSPAAASSNRAQRCLPSTGSVSGKERHKSGGGSPAAVPKARRPSGQRLQPLGGILPEKKT